MLIQNSSFPGAPPLQYNGHWQTLVPGIWRRVHHLEYTKRERIDTADGDFLDLDWLLTGQRRLLVLTHGLEGDTHRQYMRGMAKLFAQQGWDVLAWHCRSCSGEMNRVFRLYHHGDIEDIGAVVQHALHTGRYDTLVLVGFSMGGNITMKYLGVHGDEAPAAVRGAVVFSAPCDLESASETLDRWDNTVYRVRFMKALVKKIKIKAAQYPGRIDLSKLKDVQCWRDFDEWFSAPMCGYRDAADFYHNSSAKNFVGGTRRPTLLINALNDPILSPGCFPFEMAGQHPFFHLEATEGGGHCGFMARDQREYAWSELRALAFCENLCENTPSPESFSPKTQDIFQP